MVFLIHMPFGDYVTQPEQNLIWSITLDSKEA
jgi:hypothetical protein